MGENLGELTPITEIKYDPDALALVRMRDQVESEL